MIPFSPYRTGRDIVDRALFADAFLPFLLYLSANMILRWEYWSSNGYNLGNNNTFNFSRIYCRNSALAPFQFISLPRHSNAVRGS